MKEINFAFFGTPQIASKTLDTLVRCGYRPSVIITSPDKPAGRGMHLHKSEVSEWADMYNIPCLKPVKITPEFIEEFKKLNIDLSIVVAYGKILPKELIEIPKFKTINIHYSLLPKYRGASPLEQALLHGDALTGVTIQQMAFKLDSGPTIAKKEIEIDIHETKDDVRRKLTEIGAGLLCDFIPKIIDRDLDFQIQDEACATYCTKINKEDGEINIADASKGLENYNKYRAFYGWPGVYFFVNKDDKKIRIKIIKARYENNSFIIERVIPEGKKEMDYEVFLRSNISK